MHVPRASGERAYRCEVVTERAIDGLRRALAQHELKLGMLLLRECKLAQAMHAGEHCRLFQPVDEHDRLLKHLHQQRALVEVDEVLGGDVGEALRGHAAGGWLGGVVAQAARANPKKGRRALPCRLASRGRRSQIVF